MEVEFDVKISCSNLYDYLVHYTYMSLQGIIGVLAGAFFLIEYFMSFQLMYLAVAIVILCYLPVSLFLKAKHTSKKGTQNIKNVLKNSSFLKCS